MGKSMLYPRDRPRLVVSLLDKDPCSDSDRRFGTWYVGEKRTMKGQYRARASSPVSSRLVVVVVVAPFGKRSRSGSSFVRSFFGPGGLPHFFCGGGASSSLWGERKKSRESRVSPVRKKPNTGGHFLLSSSSFIFSRASYRSCRVFHPRQKPG